MFFLDRLSSAIDERDRVYEASLSPADANGGLVDDEASLGDEDSPAVARRQSASHNRKIVVDNTVSNGAVRKIQGSKRRAYECAETRPNQSGDLNQFREALRLANQLLRDGILSGGHQKSRTKPEHARKSEHGGPLRVLICSSCRVGVGNCFECGNAIQSLQEEVPPDIVASNVANTSVDKIPTARTACPYMARISQNTIDALDSSSADMLTWA